MVRVTQSMLSTNMLRNLNTSYSKMSKYQDMINTGRKFTRPSDDPVAAVKGMNYRVQLDKVNQFQRNLNEAEAWLDTTDTALDQVGTTLNRVKELVVQAANDTNTPDDRAKIKKEIDQIREQIKDVANTQLGDKYIFSGTNTQKPLYVHVEVEDLEAAYKSLDVEDQEDVYNAYIGSMDPITGELDPDVFYSELQALVTDMPTKTVRVENIEARLAEQPSEYESDVFTITDPVDPSKTITIGSVNVEFTPPTTSTPMTATGVNGKIEVEVFNGIQLTVNTNGGPEIFESIEKALKTVSDTLADPSKTGKDISNLLGSTGAEVEKSLSNLQSKVLDARADVGARMNRVELMINRLDIQEINTTKQMSNNEDTDYAETITRMATQESIHQAALSVGAKIIQQTLVDFIR